MDYSKLSKELLEPLLRDSLMTDEEYLEVYSTFLEVSGITEEQLIDSLKEGEAKGLTIEVQSTVIKTVFTILADPTLTEKQKEEALKEYNKQYRESL